MYRQWMRVCVAVLVVLVVASSPGLVQSTAVAAPDENGWIVVFEPGTPPAERAAAARGAGVSVLFNYTLIDAVAVRGAAGAVAALQRSPKVKAVVPDHVVSLPDPVMDVLLSGPQNVEPAGKPNGKPGNGSGGGTTTQAIPAGITRIGANQLWGTFTGADVGVAIVDTGIDRNHADLPVATECYPANNCQDDNGHGTHVAGIVAARNNAQDVVGVAPGATLYGVKVLNQSGSGSDASIIAGLDWVYANHATVSPNIRVVNMSLGRSKMNSDTLDANDPLWSAVKRLYDLGITVVVAAGNDSTKEVSQLVPATYPQVLAVGSTTAKGGANNSCRSYNGTIQADTASYFTTDGAFNVSTNIGVTSSAPGEEMENISKSCFIQSVGILSTRLGGGTTRMSGTSMAAPHVAGVVALMQQQASTDPQTVRSKIRSSAVRIGTAPLNAPVSSYTYDGQREGVLWAPGALQ